MPLRRVTKGLSVDEARIVKAQKPEALADASQVVMNGGLVAFPTDTVYGVGASAFDGTAISRLYEAKRRPADKPIPILLAGAYALEQVAVVDDDRILKLAEAFWPGPLTLVLTKVQGLPPEISPGSTVGVRVPDHPFAHQLLERVGPMAVSSANRSGAATTRTAREVMAQLSGSVQLIVDGGISPGGQPSTVASLSEAGLTILRQGPLAQAELLEAL
jgi:tRNA threonylcarbamoyl adenosine modification protein (Sua5/YciO/YrdC/YwlC family)